MASVATELRPGGRRRAMALLWLFCLLGLLPPFAQAAMTADGTLTVQLRLQLGAPLPGVPEARLRELRRFYYGRDFRPAWVNADGPTPRAGRWLETLRQAHRQGLERDDYHLDEIGRAWNGRDADVLARLDWLLSDAFLHYVSDVRNGRARLRQADVGWHITPALVDPVAVLESLLESNGSIVEGLQALDPPHPGYMRLKQALARYRKIAEAGGWPQLPQGRHSLEPGMTDPAVALLRQRLQASGDLASGEVPEPDRFDHALEAAVRRYQARNGLEVDGVVGRRTRAAMNVPAAERVQQIRLNMERWRWLPRDLGSRYVMVNLAGFLLEAVDHGKVVLDMPVIVGRAFTKTPAFSGKISYLVFNPYWNVPRSIIHELVAKEVKEPGYLTAEHIRILRSWSRNAEEIDPASIDWRSYLGRRFPYQMRQDPGPGNSLGRLKFMLPNAFDIYLHDTPAHSLFDKPVRTFSHGCIRVQQPVRLGVFVLDDPDWDEAAVQAVIDTGEHRILSLGQRVPVYIIYMTAWVDVDGTVEFRRDVYGRDRAMAAALE